MFGDAVKRELLRTNPFDGVSTANVGSDRKAFVDRATSLSVMAELPDAEWRLVFALCRWGGLRIGEVKLLQWSDVKTSTNRLRVHSPKTARQGEPTREVPLFPELAQAPAEADAAATEGGVWIAPMMQSRTQAALRKPL